MLTALYVSCVTLAVILAFIGWMGIASILGGVAAVLVARYVGITAAP